MNGGKEEQVDKEKQVHAMSPTQNCFSSAKKDYEGGRIEDGVYPISLHGHGRLAFLSCLLLDTLKNKSTLYTLHTNGICCWLLGSISCQGYLEYSDRLRSCSFCCKGHQVPARHQPVSVT